MPTSATPPASLAPLPESRVAGGGALMPARPKPTTTQRAAALDALRAGATPTEAARLSGVDAQSCSKWRRELGFAPMPVGRRLPAEKAEAVREMLGKGMAQAQVATRAGVSVGTVNRIAREVRDGHP